MAGADPQNQIISILSLNTKIYDAIFRELSLKDLHSLGQTCKALQKIAGEHFQNNMQYGPVYLNSNGIHVFDHRSQYERTEINGFTEFIDEIKVSIGGSFDYMTSHIKDFKSLKKIEFKNYQLTKDVAEPIKSILPQIEVVSMFYSQVIGDFYDIFLKFCPNVKEILFTDVYRDEYQTLKSNGNVLLQQKYTSLEHFALRTHTTHCVAELGTFFERNSSLRSFLTTPQMLWANQHTLLQSNAQLDKLSIDMPFSKKFNSAEVCSLKSLFDLLNSLYERGFYKRLHLQIDVFDHEFAEHFASLRALESIRIHDYFHEDCCIPNSNSLREMQFDDEVRHRCDLSPFSTNLPNLQSLVFDTATSDDVLPFIQNSTKVNNIKILACLDDLDLMTFNDERNNLLGGQKVIIHLSKDDFYYLERSNPGQLHLSLIEVTSD